MRKITDASDVGRDEEKLTVEQIRQVKQRTEGWCYASLMEATGSAPTSGQRCG